VRRRRDQFFKTFLNRRVGKNGKGWIESARRSDLVVKILTAVRDSTIRSTGRCRNEPFGAALIRKIQLPANCANKTRMDQGEKCPHQTVDLFLGVEGFDLSLKIRAD